MTTVVGLEAFPPDGKVLVVGMSVGPTPAKYKDRILSYNTWEVTGWSKLPSSVAGICVSQKIQRDALRRIKVLADQAGVSRVEEEHSSETLRQRLKFWLGSFESGEQKQPSDQLPVQIVGDTRVKVARLKPLAGQPRTHFNTTKMRELMTSIKMIGQQDPVKVVNLENDPDHDYQLIDGERRFRAIVMLGLPEIWAVVCIVKNAEDHYARSFASNFAREEHTPLDTARSIAKMLTFEDYKGLSKFEAMKRIAGLAGKHELWAWQYHRLLSLPENVQRLLEPDDNGEYRLPLTMGTFLCKITQRDIQLRVCEAVVKENLSVERAKALAHRLVKESGHGPIFKERTPNKDYRVLVTYLRKTIEGAENLVGMSHRDIGDLFEHRSLADRESAVAQIDEAVRVLGELRQAIDLREILKRKK